MTTKSIHRIRILNRYYRITRFYNFISSMLLKTVAILAIFILLFFLFDIFIIDIEDLLHTIISKFSTLAVFSIFFVSELFMGILPPELFIAWSSKMSTPWMHVLLLGTLSYAGGLIAYYTGKMALLVSVVRNYLESKIAVHIKHLRQWGGFFVFVGAMLPLPYALVSFASGLINYRLKHYMAWALFRYVRFIVYSFIIFEII